MSPASWLWFPKAFSNVRLVCVYVYEMMTELFECLYVCATVWLYSRAYVRSVWSYVSVYIVWVCLYVFMYVGEYEYVCKYECIWMCVWESEMVFECVCVWVYWRMCEIYVCGCMFANLNVSLFEYILCEYVCECVRLYMWVDETCMRLCVCLCSSPLQNFQVLWP